MSMPSTLGPRACAGRAATLVPALAAMLATSAAAQARPANLRTVVPIAAPRLPLPPEDVTADSTRFSFIFYGGMRGREDGMEVAFEHALVMRAMLDTIASRRQAPDPIRFILSNGDAVTDGRMAAQWNVSYAPVVDRLTMEGGLPYFLAAGNHDVTESDNVNSGGRRQGLTHYFRAVANLIPPDGDRRRLAGYPTYAVGYGNTFIVAFDSNIAADQKQLNWVKAQLEGLDRSRYLHVIAFAHHPAFSSGPHGFRRIERPTAALRARWMPLFRRHHVALFLAGHDHLYEHWVERYYDVDGWHQLDQIVSGGGGAPLYTYRGEPDVSSYLGAGAADSVRLDHVVRPIQTPYHFVVVHVDGEMLSLEVIGVSGGGGFRPYESSPVLLREAARKP